MCHGEMRQAGVFLTSARPVGVLLRPDGTGIGQILGTRYVDTVATIEHKVGRQRSRTGRTVLVIL